MATTLEILKDIFARRFEYPFFQELAEASIEEFPDDEAVAAAIDRICANMSLSKRDIESDWIAESIWAWHEVLRESGVPRVLDGGICEEMALAREWVDLVKTTLGDGMTATQHAALEMLKEGVVGVAWLGFV